MRLCAFVRGCYCIPTAPSVRVYGGAGGGVKPRRADETLANVAWAFAEGGERSRALFCALSKSAAEGKRPPSGRGGPAASGSLPALRGVAEMRAMPAGR